MLAFAEGFFVASYLLVHCCISMCLFLRKLLGTAISLLHAFLLRQGLLLLLFELAGLEESAPFPYDLLFGQCFFPFDFFVFLFFDGHFLFFHFGFVGMSFLFFHLELGF